eukprot:jgi/Ulvmu1/3349/UM156_0006.1
MKPGDIRPFVGRRSSSSIVLSLARHSALPMPQKRSEMAVISRSDRCYEMMSPSALMLVTTFVMIVLIVASLFNMAASSMTQVQVEAHPFRTELNKHMIIVAGHSVYVSHNFSDPTKNSNWYLLDYQNLPRQAESFVEHIRIGVREAAEDTNSVLVFSGGFTREDAGAVSEAGSYWHVADSLNWFGNTSVKSRVVLEDKARDSMENLLFSICRFRQFTGVYPQNITIVSYSFKEERFVQLHAAALGIPTDMISFIGTPPLDREGAEKGEHKALQEFKHDPYACKDPLQKKRRRRDPFHNGIPDPGTCPELQPFLTGKCLTSLHRGPLPWKNMKSVRDKTLIS